MVLQVSLLTQLKGRAVSCNTPYAGYAPWSLAARHTVMDFLVVTVHLHSQTCLKNCGSEHIQTREDLHHSGYGGGGAPKSIYALSHYW